MRTNRLRRWPNFAACANALEVPSDVAAQLPKTGRAREIVLTSEGNEGAEWRLGAYAQFLREDGPEDTIYEGLR